MQAEWRDISYLVQGTARQQQAYQVLCELRVLEVLKAYDPVLTGTIPLGIDIATSDLDIICEILDPRAFESILRDTFGRFPGFHSWQRSQSALPGVVAQFHFQDFLIEIFGEQQPVEHQNAYRHLVIEARLLAIGGEGARQAIQRLKTSGLKTEPAFAWYFQLPGNPYQTLLELDELSDDVLRRVVSAR